MNTIFLDMDGLEKASPLMLRRTLLELTAVRYAAGGARCVPLRQLLTDAGLSADDRKLPLMLTAVAQNNVVYVNHQSMYDTFTLSSTLDCDVVIECNPRLVEKWVSRAGGGPCVYTLGDLPQDVHDAMIEELDDRINLLKKHLPRRP